MIATVSVTIASSSVCGWRVSGRWTKVTAPRLVEGGGEIPAALLHRSTAAHRYLAAARVASHEGEAAVPDLEREAAPVARSRRTISPCRPLSGVVGQTIAMTVKLASSRGPGWSGTMA